MCHIGGLSSLLYGADSELHNVFQAVWGAYTEDSGPYGEERLCLLQVISQKHTKNGMFSRNMEC